MKIKRTLLLLLMSTSLVIYYFASPWQPRNFRDNMNRVIPAGEYAKIAVVGLDDNGQLEGGVSSEDMIFKQIKEQKPKVIFLFVHGWKNDGSEENLKKGNLYSFREFIKKTSEIFHSNLAFSQKGQHNLLGVYFGWHGFSRGYLQNLTFWDRYAVASSIGGNSSLLDTIFRITENARKNASSGKVRVVLFGHSMGGKILNKLLNQIENYNNVDSFNAKMPDLTLIINPAAPYDHYLKFVENYKSKVVNQENPTKVRGIQPKIVSISSETDFAIKKLYPIGVGEKAIGYGAIVTHELEKLGLEASSRDTGDCKDPKDPFVYNLICDENNESTVIKITENSYYNIKMSQDVSQTPYWIIQVPEEILKDHNSFFDESFIAFSGAIFKYAKQ